MKKNYTLSLISVHDNTLLDTKNWIVIFSGTLKTPKKTK
jgi:hypothetical protein